MKLPFTKKSMLVLIFAFLVFALGYFLLFRHSGQVRRGVPTEPEGTQGVGRDTTAPAIAGEIVFPVEAAVARRGDLVKRLGATGIVRAKREVDVVSRIGGEVVQVSVYNGKFVNAGEVLVKLDDREYWIVFEHARTMLLAAQIEYKSMSATPAQEQVDSAEVRRRIEEAERKYGEAQREFQAGRMTRDDFARARRDYETDIAYYQAHRGDVVANKSGLSQAREAYERAKMNLEATEIKAPFSGYVANCELAVGMQVEAGKVLLRLVDLSSLFVDVEVLESEIGKVKVGRKAEVSVNAFPGERFSGTVERINPIVEAKSKTAKVTVEVRDAATKLRPGMFAAVKLETEILRDRLLVPKEALLVRDQRPLVFVAQGGLAKWHYVEVGDENESFLEIRAGITPGDTVIVSGHYTLAHDAKVRITK